MVMSIFPSKLATRQPFVTKLLTNAVTRGRLCHAYLLSGRARSDKLEIARNIACFLNCANVAAGNPDDACTLRINADSAQKVETGIFCQNCRWIWDGKHPQAWLTLAANEGTKSGKISVEKARKLSEELAKESQYVRVVVIEEASQEIFHRPAANALLKTIEDPRVRCVFMLFATSAEEVLPTVVSRCQLLPLYTTDSLGLSLNHADFSNYDPNSVKLAKELIEKYIHRNDSQSLSRIIESNKVLSELVTDQFTTCDLVDLLIGIEMQRLSDRAVLNPALSGYSTRLIGLAESTKEQLEHYVSFKAALETFTIAWWRLACDTVSTGLNQGAMRVTAQRDVNMHGSGGR